MLEKNLEQVVKGVLSDVDILQRSVNRQIEDFRKKVEFALYASHREITQEHFKALEDAQQWKDKIGAVLSEPDKKLKRKLMQYLYQMRWEGEKFALAFQVDRKTKGMELVEKRKALQDELLEAERKGNDTTEIRAQLRFADWIIG